MTRSRSTSATAIRRSADLSPKVGSHSQQRNAPMTGLHRQQPLLVLGNQELLRVLFSEGLPLRQTTEEMNPFGASRQEAREQLPSIGTASLGNESGGYVPQQSGAQEPRNSNGQYAGRLPGSERGEADVEDERKRKRMPAERMSVEQFGKYNPALDIIDKTSPDEDGEVWPDLDMLAAALELVGYTNRRNADNAQTETSAGSAHRSRKNSYLSLLLGAAGKSNKKGEAPSSGSPRTI